MKKGEEKYLFATVAAIVFAGLNIWLPAILIGIWLASESAKWADGKL
jgi:ABC-type dipeptide/oligopeptide/nickel transport system permease component